MQPTKWIRANLDRVVAWGLIGGAAIALLLGWQGASTTEYPAEQLPFILSGGVGGALLLGLGAALLLSADLRDEWRKLDRIEAELHQLVESRAPADGPVDDTIEEPAVAPSQGTEGNDDGAAVPQQHVAPAGESVAASAANGSRPLRAARNSG